MTYIKKEDVLRNIKGHNADGILEHLIEDINSLPSINPEAMIEEMIEKENSEGESIYNEKELILLFAILQKFKS